MQEDKEPVFDALDTLSLVLPSLSGMISTMTVRVDRLAKAAPVGFSLATEVADWLVRRSSVRQVLSVDSALAARTTRGSTGPGPVADQLAIVTEQIQKWHSWAAAPTSWATVR